MPKQEDAYIEFKNYNNKFPCPFVIYCDFEALIQHGSEEYTKHDHIPCGFALKTISRIPEYDKFKPLIYRGESTVKQFITELLRHKNAIKKILRQNMT